MQETSHLTTKTRSSTQSFLPHGNNTSSEDGGAAAEDGREAVAAGAFEATPLSSASPASSSSSSSSSSACAIQRGVHYLVNGCRLRSPHHASAVTCLRDNPLLFLGTSVMRYQYLSLVHFLDLGRWPARCTTAHLPESNTPLEFGMPGPYTVNRSTYDRALLEKHGMSPSVVKGASGQG